MDKTTTNHPVSMVGWGMQGRGFGLNQLQPQNLMLIFVIDTFFVLFCFVCPGNYRQDHPNGSYSESGGYGGGMGGGENRGRGRGGFDRGMMRGGMRGGMNRGGMG